MSKKIILLALAVASLAAFALPAMATAAEEDLFNHLVPAPVGPKPSTGGAATLTGAFGSVKCTASSGTVTFTNSTTGTVVQKFTGCTAFGVPCQSGATKNVIETTTLEFHLVTAVHFVTGATGPGELITPNAGHFATFECPPFGKFVVGGSGLVGTTNQACGESKTEPELIFKPVAAGSREQTDKTIASIDTTTGVKSHTPTEYNLTTNGGESSEEASGKVNLGAAAKLECT
jgi:hypothetical protein